MQNNSTIQYSYYDPWHRPYSIHTPDNLFPQSLSKFSLVYLLACLMRQWARSRKVTSWPGTSTSYSIHFFTQSLSSFRNTCPFHRNLFHCTAEITGMSSNPSLSLNPLLGILSCNFMPHIHLTILIAGCWSATSFSFLTGQVSLPCNILLRAQLLYSLPLTFNDISLLVSNGTNYLNLFHPIRILFSTAVPASPSTLNMSPK